MNWGFFFGGILLGIALMVVSAVVMADTGGGESWITEIAVGVSALLAGIGGWLGKQWHGNRGNDAAPPKIAPERGVSGIAEGAMWKMVVDDLAKHEADCAEYRKATHASLSKIHSRINDVEKDLASISSSVARLDERTKAILDRLDAMK